MLKNGKDSSMESLIGGDNSSSDVSENSATSCKLSCQEKLLMAEIYKDEGNLMFKGGQTRDAMKKYHRSLLYLKGVDADQNKMFSFSSAASQEVETLSEELTLKLKKLTADCHNNLAACLLASESPLYNRVIDRCNHSLSLHPDNVKALYRKGVALYHLKKLDDASSTLHKALTFPEGVKDTSIRKYYNLVRVAQSAEQQHSKLTCQTMFKSQ